MDRLSDLLASLSWFFYLVVVAGGSLPFMRETGPEKHYIVNH